VARTGDSAGRVLSVAGFVPCYRMVNEELQPAKPAACAAGGGRATHSRGLSVSHFSCWTPGLKGYIPRPTSVQPRIRTNLISEQRAKTQLRML
jgi:hypothetical protein